MEFIGCKVVNTVSEYTKAFYIFEYWRGKVVKTALNLINIKLDPFTHPGNLHICFNVRDPDQDPD